MLAALQECAEWNAALDRRGIVDRSLVQIDPWPAGTFGLDHEKGRRITACLAYLRESPDDNGYARPLEGLLAFVDMGRGEVLEVRRHGVVPIPPTSGSYYPEDNGPLRTDLKPLEITQPEGPSFAVEGNLVRWQKWSLRVGMDPLEGLVLSTVGYEDGGRVRPILYRASVSEMVVPYGHPSPMHAWKSAFDAGEWGLGPHGQLAHPRLRLPGRDPLLRRRLRRRAGQAAHQGQRHLHARGGLRHPLEARRHGLGPHRGAPVAPAGRQLHRHRRQLRVRLLLVLLPRRHHAARGEAHRDHVDHGRGERRRPRRPRPHGGARAWPRRSTSTCSTSASTWRSTGRTTPCSRSTRCPSPPGEENPWGNAFGTDDHAARDASWRPGATWTRRAAARGASPTAAGATAWASRRPTSCCPAPRRRCWPTPSRASAGGPPSPPTTCG